VARSLFRRSGVWSPVALASGGYLVDEGWYRSFRSQCSVDRNGDPVPWYTYPCRAFLESRLTRTMRVFEYGAGMSSLWFAGRVGEITSVEHDETWAELVRQRAPANSRVVLAPKPEAYLQAIRDDEPFDMVVVDGEHRSRAAIAALEALKSDGVLVWDNSDLPEFAQTLPAFEDQGFRQLPFAGIGPISRHAWQTSILYRSDNCLQI
jgi:precorrin-6B methylase 2